MTHNAENDAAHKPVASGYLDGGCRCTCGWTGAWDEYARHLTRVTPPEGGQA